MTALCEAGSDERGTCRSYSLLSADSTSAPAKDHCNTSRLLQAKPTHLTIRKWIQAEIWGVVCPHKPLLQKLLVFDRLLLPQVRDCILLYNSQQQHKQSFGNHYDIIRISVFCRYFWLWHEEKYRANKGTEKQRDAFKLVALLFDYHSFWKTHTKSYGPYRTKYQLEQTELIKDKCSLSLFTCDLKAPIHSTRKVKIDKLH